MLSFPTLLGGFVTNVNHAAMGMLLYVCAIMFTCMQVNILWGLSKSLEKEELNLLERETGGYF